MIRRWLALLIGGDTVVSAADHHGLLYHASRQCERRVSEAIRSACLTREIALREAVIKRLEGTVTTGNNRYLEAEDWVVLNRRLPWSPSNTTFQDWVLASWIGRSEASIRSRRNLLSKQSREKKQ